MQALIKVDHNTWRQLRDIDVILEAEEIIALNDDDDYSPKVELLNQHLGSNRFAIHLCSGIYNTYEGVLVNNPAEATNHPESINVYYAGDNQPNTNWVKDNSGYSTIYRYVNNPKELIKRAKTKITKITKEQNKKNKPPSQSEIEDALRAILTASSTFRNNGDIIKSTYNIMVLAIVNKVKIKEALNPIAQRWVSNREKTSKMYETPMGERGYELFDRWCKKSI